MLISISPIWFNSRRLLPDTTALVAGILADTGERQAGRAVVVVAVAVEVVGGGPLCLEADVGNS